MKKVILMMSFLLCVSSFGGPRTSFRAGSYNLWRSDIGKGDYAWEVRKERLARSIADNGFDIFGAQEVNLTIQEELPELVRKAGGPDYTWLIFSPYEADGGVGDKAQAIVYRADLFEMIEMHHFWYSETPDVMSSGWDEQKFKRGGCCAIFRDIQTGIRFFFMLSHMPLGKEANSHAAEILVEKARQYNTDDLPAIFAGDLNTRPDSVGSGILRTWWTDTYMYLPARKTKGPQGTFNNHKTEKDMEKAARLDYIYFRGGVKPRKYVCNDARYDGFWPSDHCPVYADVVICGRRRTDK